MRTIQAFHVWTDEHEIKQVFYVFKYWPMFNVFLRYLFAVLSAKNKKINYSLISTWCNETQEKWKSENSSLNLLKLKSRKIPCTSRSQIIPISILTRHGSTSGFILDVWATLKNSSHANVECLHHCFS